MTARAVVLDAMGVVYRSGDDVAELLVPFVERQGSRASPTEVATLYEKASLGRLDPDALWRALGLDPGVEDDYLGGHELSEGLPEFLDFARGAGIDLWCLSNDVSRWSAKLRQRFALDGDFVEFVVSSDIGCRKPSTEAYACLLDRVGRMPALFVDDRARNVRVARSMGMRAVCFGTGCGDRGGVADFAALSSLIARRMER